MLAILVILLTGFSVGCQTRYAKAYPPEILVPTFLKINNDSGDMTKVLLLSAHPDRLFIQTGLGNDYLLNLETGDKQAAPKGFDPLRQNLPYLVIDTSEVPMGGQDGPFRIDLHGKTVVSEEAMAGGWGDKSPPISLIKRERFTGDMILTVSGLTLLRQHVENMALKDIYVGHNLECGLVIFRYRPFPEGEPEEEPGSHALYLIRIPPILTTKPQPKPKSQVPDAVMGGDILPEN